MTKRIRVALLIFAIMILFPTCVGASLKKPVLTVSSGHPGYITWIKVPGVSTYRIQVFNNNKLVRSSIQKTSIQKNHYDICKFIAKASYGSKITVRVQAQKGKKFSTWSKKTLKVTKILIKKCQKYHPELKPVPTPTPLPTTSYEISIRKIAPNAPERVLWTFEELQFKVVVDATAITQGKFSPTDMCITLRNTSGTHIYHELGHFLAFVAGSVDRSSSFKQIFLEESVKFPGTNILYARQNPSEYFAESMREYVLHGSALKRACPKTYSALSSAVENITERRINLFKAVYSAIK